MSDKITTEQWESEEHPRDQRGRYQHPACLCFEAVRQTLLEHGVSAVQAADVLKSLLELSGGYLIIPITALPETHQFCQIRVARSVNSNKVNRSLRD